MVFWAVSFTIEQGTTFAILEMVFVAIFVGPLSRVRPRNGILALVVVLVVVLPLRSEFIGEL